MADNSHHRWPVPVMAVGDVALGSALWRYRGQLRVTVAVKATYLVSESGPLRSLVPTPMIPVEVPGQLPSEVALVLTRAEVHVTSQRARSLRVAVYRDQIARLDKAGAPEQFSPVTEHDDLRAPGRKPLRELPDEFDWSALQTAPRDQQLERFRGDEWLVVSVDDGEPLKIGLPGLIASVRTYGLAAVPPLAAPSLDMLRLDLDRKRCALVWRTHFPIDGEEALGALTVAGGIAPANVPVDFPESLQLSKLSRTCPYPPGARPPMESAPPSGEVDLSALLTTREGATGKASPTLPFGGGSTSMASPRALPDDAPEATPFDRARKKAAVRRKKSIEPATARLDQSLAPHGPPADSERHPPRLAPATPIATGPEASSAPSPPEGTAEEQADPLMQTAYFAPEEVPKVEMPFAAPPPSQRKPAAPIPGAPWAGNEARPPVASDAAGPLPAPPAPVSSPGSSPGAPPPVSSRVGPPAPPSSPGPPPTVRGASPPPPPVAPPPGPVPPPVVAPPAVGSSPGPPPPRASERRALEAEAAETRAAAQEAKRAAELRALQQEEQALREELEKMKAQAEADRAEQQRRANEAARAEKERVRADAEREEQQRQREREAQLEAQRRRAQNLRDSLYSFRLK